jgi:hypothetical protein
MNRRDAIFRVAGMMGASLTAPLMMGLTNLEKLDPTYLPNYSINADHQKMIETIAELIIPETSTPGAKAAQVPEFIVMMLEECYPKKDRERFYTGLDQLDTTAQSTLGKEFLNNSPADQLKLLLNEEKTKGKVKTEGQEKEVPFIVMIKELTMFGYFTSEIGCTKANVYVPIPGRFDACITIPKDQKAWAF